MAARAPAAGVCSRATRAAAFGVETMYERDRYRELLAINRAIAGAAEHDEVLKRLVERATAFTHADGGLLLMANGDGLAQVVCSVGLAPDEAKRLALSLDEQVYEAIREHLGLGPDDSFMAVPVIGRGGLRGLLAVFRHGKLRAGEADDELIAAFADQAAMVFDDAERIRQLRRAKEEAEEEKLLLRTVMDAAPIALIVVEGPEARVVFANPQALALSEGLIQPGADAQSRATFHRHLDGRACQPTELPSIRALRGERVRGEVLTVTLPNGNARTVEYYAAPVPGGSKPRAIITAHDITEQQQLTEALRHSQDSLNEAQRIAHLGNWDLDLIRDRLTWSNEIYRVFEIEPTDFNATYHAFMEAIHPEDRESVNRVYTESVRNKVPYDIIHRLLMKDGRVKYVHEQCETFYDSEGRPIRSIGTMQDISERRRAELEVVKLNAELEQRVVDRTAQYEAANRELEAFAYSVSHDLRAPLRHVNGFIELLQQRQTASLDDVSKHYLEVIADAAKNMGLLIDDLLSFSRMGRIEMSKEQVELGFLVREVIGEVERDVKARTMEWRIGELPMVVGDRNMLRLALANLISNAIKFSSKRSQPRVEIGWKKEVESEIIFFVRDNGVGFDMKYADKLFKVFQRLHRKEEFEGTGIGLANVRRIVDRHGGRTWAEGAIDEGATFYCALPRPH